jgi:hypothetical protein
VRIQDADASLSIPGSMTGLLAIADGCKGHPCIMLMRREGGVWLPISPSWGLVHARSSQPVHRRHWLQPNPIEMTHWELHDFAVQIVRDHLAKAGRKVMTWVGQPGIDPSLWFVGDSGREWVVVRSVRYPLPRADRPANWDQIVERCARLGKVGHFASVSVASGDETFDPKGAAPVTPLWRGHALLVKYAGLESGP